MEHIKIAADHADAPPRRQLAALIAAVILTILWATSLQTPSLSWDEGWTLVVARTWVERGFYGRLLLNEPVSPNLAAAFPNVALVALSFKLLGVGVWQGRLPATILTIIALAVLYGLARTLYGRRVALGTLGVLLLLTPHLAVHPLFLGRQVFAEPLQLASLLAGYAALLAALRRSWLWIFAAILCWGLSLVTKAQTMPFWALSLLAPLGVALPARRWRAALLLAGGLAGAYFSTRLLNSGFALLIAGRTAPVDLLEGLTEAVALVSTPERRINALAVVLITGMHVFAGLCFAAWRWPQLFRSGTTADDHELLRLALLTLAGSWFAWFLLLSVSWARYLMPPVFVGSIFAAAALERATDGYRFQTLLPRISAGLRGRERPGAVLAALGVLLLIATYLPLTLQQQWTSYTRNSIQGGLDLAAFVHTQTAPDAIFETYDSELMFLIERPFHYPPDQINVELIQRDDLDLPITINYNPLSADPDYIIVGEFSASAKLYDEVLDRHFRLLRRFAGYDLYERIRL